MTCSYIGKAEGCKVIGVVGASHKVQLVKDLGADEVIDKSVVDLWASAENLSPSGFHHIFDANGVLFCLNTFDILSFLTSFFL
jgi:NADPH-dependent curcumin reductase CurA